MLATGDLVDGGSVAEYQHLRDIVAPLRAPLWLLPGNHDDRSALARRRSPSAPSWPASASMQFVIEGPVRVVCLDSSRPGEPGGRLDANQLEWLDATLAGGADRPHHRRPPPSSVRDRHRSHGRDGARRRRRRRASVPSSTAIPRSSGCSAAISIAASPVGGTARSPPPAPSVAHAVALDLRADGVPAWNREPPGYLLHWWTPEAGLVTHLQTIGDFPATPYE